MKKLRLIANNNRDTWFVPAMEVGIPMFIFHQMGMIWK